MKSTLVLVRHSTAARFDLAGDRARQLTEEGKRQAGELGKLLAESLTESIEQVWVSDAVRAQQTAKELLKYLPHQQVFTDPTIYEYDVDNLREIVHNCDSSSLMIIGHEPTISSFGVSLLSEECQQREQFYGGIPTASALVMRSETSLAELSCASCDLLEFIHAKPL
ncbi:hypothetical protein BK816_05415 [Boudabousia tangfeifanii]|uniref:Phosphohistidine phosphatase SixA n=1 Tax=Boudabousia tangfeifanii TaxID=1912795 RepID=A0A1D9MKJ8_9ACTO|nr:phosphoglycerate mutase family protein [Boudabousia tangfeifanii]AOZ72802.1 hypothetical protein BK816_05415 [Boudabousia tangfeifanii]